MKVTRAELRKIIKEEIKNVLVEGGYLSNLYKWCPESATCAPAKQKTKWWG